MNSGDVDEINELGAIHRDNVKKLFLQIVEKQENIFGEGDEKNYCNSTLSEKIIIAKCETFSEAFFYCFMNSSLVLFPNDKFMYFDDEEFEKNIIFYKGTKIEEFKKLFIEFGLISEIVSKLDVGKKEKQIVIDISETGDIW